MTTKATVLVAGRGPGSDVLRAVCERSGFTWRAVVVDEIAAAVAAGDYDVVVLFARPGDQALVKTAIDTVAGASPGTEVVVVTEGGYGTAIATSAARAFAIVDNPHAGGLLDLTLSQAIARRREQRAVAAMHTAGRNMFSSDSTTPLPERVVDAVRAVLSVDGVSVMLPDSEGNLYVAHSHGLPYDIREHARVRFGGRVAGRVAQQRTPVILTDSLANDERYDDVEGRRDLQSRLVYPIVLGDELLGVLNLNRAHGSDAFVDSDLHRVGVIASLAGLALHNARLTARTVMSERLATVGEVTAGITHEINNPLSYVLANLEYLHGAFDDLEHAKHPSPPPEPSADANAPALRIGELLCRPDGELSLATLTAATRDAIDGLGRIQQIISDMRSVARTRRQDAQPVDVAETVRAALRMLNARWKGHVRLQTDLLPDLVVRGNAGRICQVLLNLMVNSAQAIADAGQRNGFIEVRSRREGGRGVISVEDNGPGIPAEAAERVFDRFFTTKGEGHGTGLGLAISRDIIRELGGELRLLAHASGRGACFEIEIDEAPQPADTPLPVAAHEPTPAAARSVKRPRVLLVDDETNILQTCARGLAEKYDVVTAAGGAEALALLHDDAAYDAVVCDVVMPQMTGMDVYGAVGRDYPKLRDRMLFMTGNLGRTEVQRFLADVNNGFIEKPFTCEQLQKLLELQEGGYLG